MFDFHFESCTRLAGHQRVQRRTRRTARPSGSWFNPRTPTGRKPFEVDLLRRLAVQRRVRTVLVVPFDDHFQLVAQGHATRWNGRTPQPVFDCPQGTLQHGNAAASADGSKPRLNVVLSAPAIVSRLPELASFVTDQMPRRGPRRGDTVPDTRERPPKSTPGERSQIP